MSDAGVIEVVTESEEQTLALAAQLAGVLRPGDVLALHGELGAGKTRFVRGLLAGLGGDPGAVSSPTFVLVQHYALPGGPALRELVHVDAYRLRGPDDLDSIGWDALAGAPNIIAVEWPERVGDQLPSHRFEVFIEHHGEGSRRIRIVPPPGRGIEWAV